MSKSVLKSTFWIFPHFFQHWQSSNSGPTCLKKCGKIQNVVSSSDFDFFFSWNTIGRAELLWYLNEPLFFFKVTMECLTKVYVICIKPLVCYKKKSILIMMDNAVSDLGLKKSWPVIFNIFFLTEKCPECPYGSTCFRGQCKCPTDCPSQYQPVCGSDGRTVRLFLFQHFLKPI